MKNVPRIALLLWLLVFVSSVPAQVADPNQVDRLTNTEVVGMIRDGLPSEIVIAKIKVSRCNFDTDPTQLSELKSKGVPNDVLRAMIEAPYGVAAIAKPMAPSPMSEPVNVEPKPKKKIIVNDLPVYGSPEELRKLHNVYVTSDEPTSRDWILSVLRKYEGLRIVNSPEDAEFVLECLVKSSTESRGRQPSHYLRTLMTAYTVDDEGRKRILWTENETYEETNGLSFSRPNEMNLARHFVSMIKKMRGEKK